MAIEETIKVCNFLGDVINVSAYPSKEKYSITKKISLKPYDSKKGPHCQNLILTLKPAAINFQILVQSFTANTPSKVKVSELKISYKAGTRQQQSKQIEINDISMSSGTTAYILGIPTGEGMAYREKPQPQKIEKGMVLSSLSRDNFSANQVICLMYRGVNSAPCNIDTISK